MAIVAWWLEQENKNRERGISSLAFIHPTAKIGKDVHISPYAVREENVVIGDNSYIGANSVLMNNVELGQGCKIFPIVVIYEDCKLGNNVTIHSGSVIGADGFGYAPV
jgi:UDP-3-O-[3-hydroxymyristoyl] glucosamine N-acyltransferase